MNSSKRLETVLVIWGAFGIASALSFVGGTTTTNDLWLAGIFAVAALSATLAVLRWGVDTDNKTEKNKRDDRDITHLIDSLDDEQLETLRKRLGIRDEAPADDEQRASIGELIQQKRGR
jgi:hypothetical protein